MTSSKKTRRSSRRSPTDPLVPIESPDDFEIANTGDAADWAGDDADDPPVPENDPDSWYNIDESAQIRTDRVDLSALITEGPASALREAREQESDDRAPSSQHRPRRKDDAPRP